MSKNYIEEVLENIRKLTPNISKSTINKKKTFTQTQWEFNMKRFQSKENLRKKSTRLRGGDYEIVTLDVLDKLLEIESKTNFTKKWEKLEKKFKINLLMDYYGKSLIEINSIFDKLDNNDIEYDERLGKIINIANKNIFNKDK